ncbi:MAG TPA: hypothetical protein DCE56_14945 [Cyanobacteria bacterium UBA8553]|nr:hypothetical protein [Cyanobacteria bacterium UBA8553]
MKNLSESLTFTVPLSSCAHHLAEQFRRKQSNQKKGKQVYLNTLAVSAVNFYLRCMGIETDWEVSQSRNLVMLSVMDVADVEIPNLGKLECRPVLPQDKVVYIPSEVWSDRIGYVAVQFDESLRVATLLGFSPTAGNGELPISELRSLEDLLEHLRQIQQTKQVKMRVNLSQWFENLFETGWQSVEALFGKNQENLAFSFRSPSGLSECQVKRAKLINLGLQLGSQSVALLVALAKQAEVHPTEAIAPEADRKVGILVQVHPVGEETYLPPNLRLALLSQAGDILQDVQSRSQDNYIQLKRFRGNPGESFNIQVAFGNATMTETFEI